ncbi:sigma-70 family RNA polymerase sigma factor [Kordiimonas sp. SCSIO 12603]|uniref:RNA polymerase sigma factor n=1 Tax=Kordiimonas sp. SCSIO 12603 TaxID=2829596 RepID=UPI0021080D44|nr:sigma-70 family RNA polymerase sigma factor [Kordiimonas sp. SCSIO 12603]UTW58135.1 sigma-70 family RNA polymerase sigma factor [Kordiimonas sp. SCSIO 12603]
MTGTRTKEELLVLKAQAGSKEAFELLYKLYQPSLLRFAFKILGDADLAQDAMQDAWIMLARTLSELKHTSMFRARAFRAVRWRAFDLLRKRDNSHEELSDEAAVDNENESKVATSGQINALINRLPPAEKHTVYLFYLEELSIAEIAVVMETKPGTVKSRLHAARARLRQQTEGEE